MSKLVWPELFFIRHGETFWNAERRYQGQRDIALNSKGEGQALANGQLLARVFAERGIDPNSFEWHASPLGRTRQTMDRVRLAFKGPLPEVQYDVRLVEISFGALEGMLFDELPEDVAIAPGKRDASYWHFRPEAGENYQDLAERLTEFGKKLVNPSIIVAHGGVARAMRVLVESAAPEEVMNWTPRQDVIMHFKDGVFEVIEDTAP